MAYKYPAIQHTPLHCCLQRAVLKTKIKILAFHSKVGYDKIE